METSGLDNINQFIDLLSDLSPKIGATGGRYFEKNNGNAQYRLNDLVKSLEKTIQNSPKSISEEWIKTSVNLIRKLDQHAQDLLNKASFFTRLFTACKQIFGNLLFDRELSLQQMQFADRKPVTSVGNYRLLPLKGEQGTVFCRVRGISSHTLPALSDNGVIEFFSRTYARLKNLIAVRGTEAGAHMVGPCDYFGNLEKAHEHEYTIEIDKDGVPVFFQHPKRAGAQAKETESLGIAPATRLKARWLSAGDPRLATAGGVQGDSLFENKGILEFSGNCFPLEKFDATKVDLAPYKAQLVKNDVPFRIANEKVPSADDFRAVTYLYQSKYADWQVTSGGGLFLETHSFAQTITPLDKSCRGFVTLAKWADDKKEELDVIAVEVPFGHTLVIEEYSIHGDTNVDGLFMMCMTSYHETMNKADTVFLRNVEGHKNIALYINNADKKEGIEGIKVAARPFVTYNNASFG